MNNYDFPSIVAVKIVVKRDDAVLVLREPETNSWMPGRLALPGGKLLLNESIEQALDRKIKTEIGLEINVQGLIRIINILMPDKNVYHFVFLADYLDGEIDTTITESKEFVWLDSAAITQLSKDDFAEWYNDELLKQVLQEKVPASPSVITTQDNRQKEIQTWMEKGN